MKLGTSSFNPVNPFDWGALAKTTPSRINVMVNSPYSVESARANARRDKLSFERKALRYQAMIEGVTAKKQAESAVAQYKSIKAQSAKQKAHDSRYEAIAEARQKASATIGLPMPELGG